MSFAKNNFRFPHQIVKGNRTKSLKTGNIITVIQVSVAGQGSIITGENSDGKIESFFANSILELVK